MARIGWSEDEAMLIQDKIVIIPGAGPGMGQARIGIAGAQGASAVQATSQQVARPLVGASAI